MAAVDDSRTNHSRKALQQSSIEASRDFARACCVFPTFALVNDVPLSVLLLRNFQLLDTAFQKCMTSMAQQEVVLERIEVDAVPDAVQDGYRIVDAANVQEQKALVSWVLSIVGAACPKAVRLQRRRKGCYMSVSLRPQRPVVGEYGGFQV